MPIIIVEGKKIVGGVLASLDIAHVSQLIVQSFYTMSTYSVPKIFAALTDGRLWRVFSFSIVHKTDVSLLVSLMKVEWYKQFIVEESPKDLLHQPQVLKTVSSFLKYQHHHFVLVHISASFVVANITFQDERWEREDEDNKDNLSTER